MSDLTLGNWEIVDDDTNSRLILRSTQTGNEYYLNEDGNLEIPSGGGADLQQLAGALDANGNNVSNVGTLSAAAVDTETVGSERHFAGGYSGSDADARLSSALSAATDGDIIYLENATYLSDLAVSKFVTFIGTGSRFVGTEIDANWTFSSRVILKQVSFEDPTGNVLTIDGNNCGLYEVYCRRSSSIEVNGTFVKIVGVTGGEVTFTSNASSCIIDSSTNVTTTDNGTNTVGDIA